MTEYIFIGGGLVLAGLGLVFVVVARSRARKARALPRTRTPNFERAAFLEGHPFADGRPEVSEHPGSPSRAGTDHPERRTMDAESDDSLPPH